MKEEDQDIARLLAGDLDEGEKQALAKKLTDDPDGLRSLGGHALIDGLLGVALEDEFSTERRRGKLMEVLRRTDQDDFLSGVQGKIHRRIWRNRLLASAAVLVLSAVGWIFSRPPGGNLVASVSRMETLDWGSGTPFTTGKSLVSGTRLRFDSGLVELDMAGRGRMIVEGPADLELAEPMRSVLHRGRILMRVTEAGHGYRLETSKGSVVDLGTEFGVSVDERQGVETHVLDGEVEALPDGGGKVLLRKNDALRFDGGNSERIAADGGTFYTALPPVRTKTTRVVHWPLEAAGGLRDTAEVRGCDVPDCDMVLRSMDQGTLPKPVAGIFGNALSFDGKGGFAESAFPGIGGQEPRTVSFWVKVPVDFNPLEGFGIISWGEFTDSDFGGVWQISINPIEKEGPIGNLRVGAHGGQIVGSTDLRDGRWHHVAVVLYEASQADIGKHVLIYLDGELEPISRRALREMNTRVADASHGVWLGRNVTYTFNAHNHHQGRFFRGAVDEAFVFNGALSRDEIRKLMQKNEMPR